MVRSHGHTAASPFQASGRRRGVVIPVVSGKGGVGKSNLALNLGIQLARRNVSTLLVDADLGLANTDILLDVTPLNDVTALTDPDIRVDDLAILGPGGLQVICGVSGPAGASRVESDPHLGGQVLDRLRGRSEVVLVDCAAGITPLVTSLALAGDRVLLVTTPEPTALADAYATLKVLSLRGLLRPVSLVVNLAGHREAADVYRRLDRTCRQFLNLAVGYWGSIPADRHVTLAVNQRCPVTERYPRCAASLAISDLTRQIVTQRRVAPDRGMWARVASLFL